MFGLLISCQIPSDSAWIFLVKLLLNNLNLFNDIRTGLWCCIIDSIISGYVDFLIRHIFQMVYQWTSFSEDLFFSFPSGFFTCQLLHYATSTSQLIITHQLHNYLSYLIFFSFEPWMFWQLPSCFQVSSYFLSFFGCCECCLPHTEAATGVVL